MCRRAPAEPGGISAGRSIALHELADRCGDAVDLFVRQLRVHRQRQDLRRKPFRHGQIALAIAEELRRLLQVDRDRIVDLRTDAPLAQVLPEVVPTAARHPDAVDVKDVALAAWDLRRDHAGAAEKLLVGASQLTPAFVPLRKPTTLGPEDRGMSLVDARGVCNDREQLTRRLSVRSDGTEL